MKVRVGKRETVVLLAAVMIFAFAASSYAMMGGMSGGGGMMTSTGGFGMMDGTAGGPLVGSDGTTYMSSIIPSSTPGTYPTSTSFMSNIMAISLGGQMLKMTVSGIMSKPVLVNNITVNGMYGNYEMATVSLPNMSNYSIMHNYGSTTGKSVLYWMKSPFTASSVPMAVEMDGMYASQPVIMNVNGTNMIYVMTTNNGSAMMQGVDVFNNTFPSYMASNMSSYLYVFRMDGTMVSHTEFQ